MNQTHEYTTIALCALQLDHTCVLVGESGGLSAVYEARPTATFDVETVTEHGTMVVPPETLFSVLWPTK